jgi:hypothetical protein
MFLEHGRVKGEHNTPFLVRGKGVSGYEISVCRDGRDWCCWVWRSMSHSGATTVNRCSLTTRTARRRWTACSLAKDGDPHSTSPVETPGCAHSYLSATMGSTLVARRAGMAAAISAAATKTAADCDTDTRSKVPMP